MKKSILSIMLMLALPVMAQNAPTTPTAPTIPTLLTVSPNAVAALADSTTNRVLIDQSGDNPTVNITQVGSGNRVGGVAGNDPIVLRGIDQKVVIIQAGANGAAGNNNKVTLQLFNDGSIAQGGTSPGASVTVRQIGNSNIVDAVCGDSTTGCNKADINWRFAGNSNEMYFRGSGANLTSHIDVAGNQNVFNVAMSNGKHSQVISVAGDQNNFQISQTSTGANGSSIVIAQQGTGTAFNISQGGSVDNVLNIHSVANGGSFNITQRN